MTPYSMVENYDIFWGTCRFFL